VVIRDPLGKFRMGKFRTQALLCADLDADPQQIVSWFMVRWQLEVTVHEVRAHLGVETQRQWSSRAILRTTPALMRLYSVVTLLAHDPMLFAHPLPALRQTAWYTKTTPTFGDALALVRRRWWTPVRFPPSPCSSARVKVPRGQSPPCSARPPDRSALLRGVVW
jgi:hypothetical protein